MILVALAGAPNVGKSTIFNVLTGLHQRVGNWPGKTIERKEGFIRVGAYRFHIVDLPGTYSLTSHSPEEEIARSFILEEQPDVIVAVVDAASLERSLYVVSELVMIGRPVVLALNMMDIAQRQGIKIEPQVLEAAMGVPVVSMSAARREGVDELIKTIVDTVEGRRQFQPKLPTVAEDHLPLYERVKELIAPFVPAGWPLDWVAMKVLDGDGGITEVVRQRLPKEQLNALSNILLEHDDAQVAVASGRYQWIGRMVRAAVVRPRIKQVGWTERIDRWATHPLYGMLLLGLVLAVSFYLTYHVGVPLQQALQNRVLDPFAGLAGEGLKFAPAPLRRLIVDGVIAGVGTVLSFGPILVVFFFVFAVLEDIGYLARAAFVMDRFMHRLGLHGKSFLPLVLGAGCNVPAVLSTRIIDLNEARLLTIFLIPFVPCSARLAVVNFLGPLFFGKLAPIYMLLVFLIDLFLLFLSGVVVSYVIFAGQRSAFIMELPLYHLPNLRTVILTVWQEFKLFAKKAGGPIVGMCVIFWAFSYFPDGEFQTSFLARVGARLDPVARILGWDWRLLVVLLASFPAKENAVATLAILTGAEGDSLSHAIQSLYSPAIGLSFLTSLVLFVPCAATLAVVRSETRSWKWVLISASAMLAVSLLAGALVYRTGLLLQKLV